MQEETWPKFNGGQLVATAAVAAKMEENEIFRQEVLSSLQRHFSGDWGELDDEDKQTNEEALETGERILSAYHAKGIKIWIITEAEDEAGNRSATTVLFPSEY